MKKLDKANIIISIIIVLCIAAAVAAYGITNSDNPIFSDLSSMSSNNNGNGIGNNSTNMTNSSGSVAVTNGGSGSGSGGASSSGSGSGAGSGYSSGSSNSGTQYSQQQSSSSQQQQQRSSSSTHLSYSSAQSIANSAVGEPGCYAGSVSYSGGVWYATIYDENGNAVDSITIDDATGSVGRG